MDEGCIFRCKCGHYHYLDVCISDDEYTDGTKTRELFVAISDEPFSLMEKLRWVFRKDKAWR